MSKYIIMADNVTSQFDSLDEFHHPVADLLAEEGLDSFLVQSRQYHLSIASRNIRHALYRTSQLRYYARPLEYKKKDHRKKSFLRKFETPKTLKVAGQEKSVLEHEFDDCAPIYRDPYDISKISYTPRHIEYMWLPMNAKRESAMLLKQQIGHFLKLNAHERVAYMNHTTDIRKVTTEDCRGGKCDKELVGHRGLFAAKDLKPLTILGIYSGVFLQSEQDMRALEKKIDSFSISDYLFRVAEEYEWPKISAFQYGNRLTMVNAATNYAGGISKGLEEVNKRLSVMLAFGKSKECPFPEIGQNDTHPDILFFITCKDVAKGDQLMIDYGPVYWANNDK